MARTFATNQGLYVNSTCGVSAYPFTLAAWFSANTTTSYETLMCFTDSASLNNYWILGAYGGSSGDPIVAISRNGGSEYTASSTTGFSANTWQHAAGVFRSNTDRSAYLNGGSRGNNTSDAGFSANRLAIGYLARSSPADYTNGKIATAGMWNVDLSDSEIAALANGVPPHSVRPGNLMALFGLDGLEGVDRDGWNRYQLTAVNAPSRSDAPPKIWTPSKRIYSFKAPTVAGTSAAVFAHHNRMMRVA